MLGNVSKCATVRYSASQRALGGGTATAVHISNKFIAGCFAFFFNRTLQEGIEAEQKGTKHKKIQSFGTQPKTKPGQAGWPKRLGSLLLTNSDQL